MLKVQVGKNEPIDSAMRRLTKKVVGSGTIAEVKKRMYYESPQARKKRRKKIAVRKSRKRAGLPV